LPLIPFWWNTRGSPIPIWKKIIPSLLLVNNPLTPKGAKKGEGKRKKGANRPLSGRERQEKRGEARD